MYNLRTAGNFPIFYFTDSLTASDKLIEFIEELDLKEKSYSAISKWNNNEKIIVEDSKPDDLDINLKTTYVINSIKRNPLFCLKTYTDHYKIPSIKIDSDIKINKYSEGQTPDYYFPASKKQNLALGIILFINDNYDGGEIFFPNQNIRFKPEKSSMLIFPATDEYRYEVSPVTGGVKYESPLYGIIG